jgi:hypothetical protein
MWVVGVFPDEEGGGCGDDVGVGEEEADKAGGGEGFEGAFGSEAQGKVG